MLPSAVIGLGYGSIPSVTLFELALVGQYLPLGSRSIFNHGLDEATGRFGDLWKLCRDFGSALLKNIVNKFLVLRVVPQVASFPHLHCVFLLFLITSQCLPFFLLALALAFAVTFGLPHFLHFLLGLGDCIILNFRGKAYGLGLRSNLLFGFSGGEL